MAVNERHEKLNVMAGAMLHFVPLAAFALVALSGEAAEVRFLVRPDSGIEAGCALGHAALPCAGMNPARVSARVAAANGAPAPAGVFWSAPGELLKVGFDLVPGEREYWITISDRIAPSSNWVARSGLLLETRQSRSGAPVESLADFRKRWDAAAGADGRGFVASIFHGANPHGRSERFLSLYSGFFRAAAPGEYEFATLSSDASFLLVNGRPVADWPGLHPPRDGRHGEHSGRVRLDAGMHCIEYAHAQCAGASCAVAAWKQPGEAAFQVMPPGAFAPAAEFKPAMYEPLSDDAPRACFTWQAKAHTRVDSIAVVLVLVSVLGPDPGAAPCRWIFGDGVKAVGRAVEHIFPKAGMRAVRLEVEGRGAIEQDILVAPNWAQANDWPEDLFRRQVRDFTGRDWRSAPVADAIAAAQWADRVGAPELAARAGESLIARASEVPPDDCQVFVTLGRRFWGHDLGRYDMAERSFRIALEKGAAPARRQAALQLAAFLIHLRALPDDARAALDAVEWQGADSETQRARTALLADAALMDGDAEAARRGYAEADREPRGNRRAALARLALLDAANNCLARGELDEAARLVRKVEADNPLEKLRPESGLILLDVFLGRREYQAALARSRLLEPVVSSERQRAQRLGKTVLALRALGRTAEAGAALKTLLADYPYSEAAAEAVRLQETSP